jgi:hypothetical protein
LPWDLDLVGCTRPSPHCNGTSTIRWDSPFLANKEFFSKDTKKERKKEKRRKEKRKRGEREKEEKEKAKGEKRRKKGGKNPEEVPHPSSE